VSAVSEGTGQQERRTEATPSTAFEALGGDAGVLEVVDELYARVRADEELAPYFHRTDMAAQRQKLAEMITEALGGPPAPWLLSLDAAHRGRGITHRHFSLLCAHLVDVVTERGLGEEVDDLIDFVNQARPAVVEDAG
jgi:hemoglobin